MYETEIDMNVNVWNEYELLVPFSRLLSCRHSDRHGRAETVENSKCSQCNSPHNSASFLDNCFIRTMTSVNSVCELHILVAKRNTGTKI